MMGRTHLATGALVAGSASFAIGEVNLALVAGSLAGSVLPDVDHPKSKLGRWLLPVSLPIYLIFGHRGGTHSLLFVILCAVALIADVHFGIGLVLGVLIHIFADMLSYSTGTPLTKGGGCPLAYPRERRYGFRLLRVNGVFENIAILPAAILMSFAIFNAL